MSKSQPQFEPTDSLVSASCLDFLLIEIVPLAQRLTEQLHARDKVLIEARRASQLFSSNSRTSIPARTQQRVGQDETTASDNNNRDSASIAHDSTVASTTGASAATATAPFDSSTASDLDRLGGLIEDDETRNATWFRLEQIGYRVGQGLVERFSANKPRPQTHLDCIKFLCKDFWTLIYRKPIDNLKTNHRGIFVLTDTRFYPLGRMSVDIRTATRSIGGGAIGAGPGTGTAAATAAINKAQEEALQRAQSYLVFPSGLIRGVLQGLGVECTVIGESGDIPGARFEVRVKGAKS